MEYPSIYVALKDRIIFLGDTDRDFYMNAQEAKKYGIIDEAIKK